MSMAVVDDTPIEETEGTEPVAVPEPTFREIMDRQMRFRARQFWRAIIIPIRSVFFLEEDSMRDQMIMGLRADVDYLASRVAGSISGVNLLNERLSAHEEAIPRMRVVKNQFDATKRAEQEAREAEAAMLRAEELAKAQALEDGVLIEP